MKAILVTIILPTGCISTTAYAQSINKPKLDSFFNMLCGKNKAMGSVAICKSGYHGI